MNILAPLLIALAVSSPLLALMVWLHVWVQRHPQPDLARLKLLRVLLWVLAVMAFVLIVSDAVFGGTRSTSAPSGLLSLVVLVVLGANIVAQIRGCQRRLGKK